MVLMSESLDEVIGEDNPARVTDLFVNELNFGELGFTGNVLAQTG